MMSMYQLTPEFAVLELIRAYIDPVGGIPSWTLSILTATALLGPDRFRLILGFCNK